MARRRNRLSPGYFGRTKGHSILPQRSYGLSPRSSRYNADEDYPVYRPPTSTFHTGADYFVADAMASHATAIGSNTVYDNYDLATKSRGKDKRLMSQVNAALAYASPSTPARARASRRANRERAPVQATSAYQTQCTAPTSVPYQEASSYEVPYVSDRFDRFNIRKPKTTSPGIYGTGLIASKPVPKPSGARTIRQNEGYSRPKNLLSWQYRLDAYMNPKDIFYTPASVYRMKEQLRDVHEKLDRHRQMLDRYIDVDLGPGDDVSARIARRHADIEAREKSV